ncbi:hypothetical protein [Siphonobacter sp. SORGH_AS_0500]|uniref:hypothetical protein n=1 Tax=Siphonobacter sp. SORGH_AS_0500 TaxID=1864824 RepID=UPI002861FB29|nr:hypothetical protein [Siphonobacter sp. SORGH_AS_0500]MDR6194314.1 hypothetical protein [Siphonobacter sp. SORGH_AS_0500]
MLKRICLLFFLIGCGLSSGAQSKPMEQRTDPTLEEPASGGGISKVLGFIKKAGKAIDNPSKLKFEVIEDEQPPREKPRSGFSKFIHFIKDVGKVMDDPTNLKISVEEENNSPRKPRRE